MLERLGAWAARRLEPRLWISVAGAGCLMAVTGLLAIAGDAQVEDSGESGSTTPGILIFLLVVVAGYLLMHFLRETPAATAGVTAVVLGLPPLAWFLTFDESDVPPVSIEAVLGLPALVWLVSYFVGPGRGRSLLLATGLIFAWLFVLQVIEDPTNSGSLEAPLVEEEDFGAPFDEDFSDEDLSEDDFGSDDQFGDAASSDEPSLTTVGVISVLFGAGYLVGVRLLDRRGYAGTGTAMVVAGHIALPIGIGYLSDTLEVGGTGVAFAIAGGLVAWLGAVGGRRVTTIIGALQMIFGLYLVVGDAMEESSATSVGVALFVLGGIIVALAHLLHVVTGETPQTTPGPSRFSGRPAPGSGDPWGPGGGAYAPHAGGPPPFAAQPGGPQPVGPHPGAPQSGAHPGVPPAGGPAYGGGPRIAPGPPPPPPPPPAPGGSAF